MHTMPCLTGPSRLKPTQRQQGHYINRRQPRWRICQTHTPHPGSYLTPCQASERPDASDSSPHSNSDSQQPPETQQRQQGGRLQAAAPPRLPAIMDGVNWYCYACLGLLFLTDFTPVGQWLLASSSMTTTASSAAAGFPPRLAALQWAVFVLPSLLWIKRSGWDLPKTLKLQPSTLRQYVTGLLAGPLLWLCINAAVALRTGNAQQFAAAFTDGLGAADAAAADVAASPGMLLLGVGAGGIVSMQQVLLLLVFAAASPAVAEELLFRGLLLTAVQQRLGTIDAVSVVAALFALIHLDLQQFFQYCVLGGACGLIAVRSGSVAPAIVLHAAFNATAIGMTLLVHT